MAIRVIIERRVEPGNELKLNELLIKLRSEAMRMPGYISGETLRSLNDPHEFIVISTWNSLEEWKAWNRSEKRQNLQEEIDRMLKVPSKATIYVYD